MSLLLEEDGGAPCWTQFWRRRRERERREDFSLRVVRRRAVCFSVLPARPALGTGRRRRPALLQTAPYSAGSSRLCYVGCAVRPPAHKHTVRTSSDPTTKIPLTGKAREVVGTSQLLPTFAARNFHCCCCACSQLSTCAFLLLSQRPRGTTASPIEEQQVRNHPAPPMRDRDGRRRDGRGKPRDGRTKPTAAERKVTMPSISSRTRSLYCSFNFPR